MGRAQRVLFVISCLLAPSVCCAKDLLALKIVQAVRQEDPRTGGLVLMVTLDSESASKFKEWTSRHVGEMIDAKVGGDSVSQSRLLNPIAGGIFQIWAAAFRPEQVDELAQKLSRDSGLFTVEVKD